MGFFQKMFQSGHPEQALDSAVMELKEKLSPELGDRAMTFLTQGPMPDLQTTPFELSVNLQIDLDMPNSKAFPLLTEVEGNSFYSIRFTMDFFHEFLRCTADYYKKHKDPEKLRSLRLDVLKRLAPQDIREFSPLTFHHQWTPNNLLPSGPGVTLAQRVVRKLKHGWGMACFGFEMMGGGQPRLVDGYELLERKEGVPSMAYSVDPGVVKSLEDAAASYATAHPAKFLTIHLLHTSNPRFGWMALIRRYQKAPEQQLLPFTWNPSATAYLVDAYNQVAEKSIAWRDKYAQNGYRYDEASGMLDFGKMKRKAKIICSICDLDFVWLWEWDHKTGVPEELRGIRERLKPSFPQELLNSGQKFRAVFWDYLLLPFAIAVGAGFPLVFVRKDDQTKIDAYLAIEKE